MTPYFLLEERLLRRNLELISRVARESGAEIILAFKAFALWRTFPILRQYISHTTASSLWEARLALEEFGSLAHTYSPAYTDDDFPGILRCSGHLTFNSLSQYRRFWPQVEAYQEHPVSCGLRINPEYSEIETELYNPCAPGSRFGLLASQMPDPLPPGIEGFHCHCHCESGADVFARTLAHIEDKYARWFGQLKWINFGGGHLMTRKDYDVPYLINILKEFRERHPNLHVILEPGSAFAWQTGPLVAHVVDVVEDKGIRTAILDVSFTCHMPDCLEMPYMPEVRGAVQCSDIEHSTSGINPQPSEGTHQPSTLVPRNSHLYRLGGNSCLSGDYLGMWRFDHELEVGEPIVLEDMIHYTTVKTTMFNGIGHPAIGMIHTDGTFQLYRQFRYEDYRDRMC